MKMGLISQIHEKKDNSMKITFAKFQGKEEDQKEALCLEKISNVTFKDGLKSTLLAVPGDQSCKVHVQMDCGQIIELNHTEKEFYAIVDAVSDSNIIRWNA